MRNQLTTLAEQGFKFENAGIMLQGTPPTSTPPLLALKVNVGYPSEIPEL